MSDRFQIASGCVSGYAPAFTAGTTNNQAGVYSPFTLTFSRKDGEQTLGRVSVTTPPGLLGKLAGVGECSEVQIAAASNNPSGAAEQANPSCPAGSQIGTVTVGAGAGPDPYYVTGKAYLTGPYKGGPFGLAVVVPAVAGPFDLGNVVVRSSLYIDPHTAQVTVISDPFPTILDGIPIRLRSVNVSIDRPGFVLNPTNCTPMAVTGTITSTQGATVPVSSRFQVTDCANLPFKPSFSASTQGNGTVKGHGASLTVKLTFPHSGPQSGSQSGEANVKSVKVKLPSALPARLTTLQKACTEKQFAENPAGCPKASLVGMAIAHTPILSVPLQGPVYLVSHGGAAFPDVVMILQGEGIVIDLVGNTEIKGKITTSTFASVPDAPVSSFELKLPEGEFSALSANGNLCTQKLVMPTEFVAQNGATLSQNTHIEVEGCEFVVKVKSGKSHRREPRRTGIKQVRTTCNCLPWRHVLE